MKVPFIFRLGFCSLLLGPAIILGQVPHLTIGNVEANNGAPLLDLNGAEAGNDFSVNFVPGGGPISIVDGNASDGEALTVIEDTNHLVSATIRLTNALNGASEILAVTTAGTDITASLTVAGSSRTLMLTGFDTKTAYQKVLRTASYNNTAGSVDTTPRSVEFRLNDGSVQSAVATTTITIGAVSTPTPTATPTPSSTPPTRLGNISTRLRVEVGDNALFAGFIITGTQDKKIMVRGLGPSTRLIQALPDPRLELRNSSGVLLEANDNWIDSPNKQAILDSTIAPESDVEAAIVATLPANGSAYTAIVRGVGTDLGGDTGIGVVEAYDLDNTVDSKLANISTRGFVQTGDDIMIAGTIVVGQAAQQVIVRAIGPSLTVPGKLEDPILELRDANGGLIRENDNWRIGGQEGEIIATTIPPTDEAESAIVASLPAAGASYTAIVRGVNGTTGIAVVEVYALQ